MSLLETIQDPSQLKGLTHDQDLQLCEEIRTFLIKHVTKTGGHLASNLGVVELTLALEKTFDFSRDRLVFDVGHQCYVHKMLTGRMNEFDHLRMMNGIAGFPKPNESPYDAFVAGHASSSVSAALGLARARTRSGQDHTVVALLGDGALTGGLAYEALNDAGQSGESLIVVLNDNGMSIEANVGSVSKHLAQIRLKPSYFHIKQIYRELTQKIPGGRFLYRITHAIKQYFKKTILGSSIFESMGFTYLGPVDGHDVEKLCYLLDVSRQMNGPVLLHVVTKKGKGMNEAEIHPERYHGLNPAGHSESGESFAAAFGQKLRELALNDSRIMAVTAAMPRGTGLHAFQQQLPEQFFDVGIAEGHAVTMASGMAAGGLLPVVAIYSTFLQRAFDMIIQDTALMQNHVVFAIDRAGLVGEDGETHHGVFDLQYLRCIPGMRILAPVTPDELREMLPKAIYEYSGPVALRYPRGNWENLPAENRIHSDPDITIGCYGTDYWEAVKCADLLEKEGITADLIRLKELKPLPDEELLKSVRKSGRLLISEQTVSQGCVGESVACALAGSGVEICLINFGDSFVTHGSTKDLLDAYGLSGEKMFRKALEVFSFEGTH